MNETRSIENNNEWERQVNKLTSENVTISKRKRSAWRVKENQLQPPGIALR